MTDIQDEIQHEIQSPPRLEQARSVIEYHTFGVGAAALFIPVPLLDIPVVAGLQLNLVRSLAKIYDQPFSEQLAKTLISALVGASVPAVTLSVLRMVPFWGRVGASVGGVASTYAIGNVFVQHFESGGTFLTFDPAKVREHYERELNNAAASSKDPSPDIDYGGIKP